MSKLYQHDYISLAIKTHGLRANVIAKKINMQKPTFYNKLNKRKGYEDGFSLVEMEKISTAITDIIIELKEATIPDWIRFGWERPM